MRWTAQTGSLLAVSPKLQHSRPVSDVDHDRATENCVPFPRQRNRPAERIGASSGSVRDPAPSHTSCTVGTSEHPANSAECDTISRLSQECRIPMQAARYASMGVGPDVVVLAARRYQTAEPSANSRMKLRATAVSVDSVPEESIQTLQRQRYNKRTDGQLRQNQHDQSSGQCGCCGFTDAVVVRRQCVSREDARRLEVCCRQRDLRIGRSWQKQVRFRILDDLLRINDGDCDRFVRTGLDARGGLTVCQSIAAHVALADDALAGVILGDIIRDRPVCSTDSRSIGRRDA